MSFESTSTLQQPDDVSAAAAASSGSLGGGGGGGTGIEVIQLDAGGGNVTETLPAPSSGATALALRVDTSTGNTATLDTPGSQEIRFAEGKNVSSTTLDVEQSLLLSSDGNNWYVEEGQGLSAEAEAVTTDAATKDSPSLTQTATYDSDGTTSVTSSDVSIERYVRTDNNGNATLVYESGGTEIARLTDAGRFETRKDQEAFMDGSLNSGQGTNSLLQVEDGQGDVLTTDAASLQFTGSGISLTKSGDEITVDISGGSGSDIDIEQNQTPVVGGATGLSFEGSGVNSVNNDGDGTATVNISKGFSTEIQEGGTAQVSDVAVLDFVGPDFSVANPTSKEAEVSLQNDTVTVAGNAVSLGNSTAINHGDLSSIGSSDHHAKTTSAADLTDVSADSVTDAHHAKYTDSDAVDALQAHDGTAVDADTLDGVEGANYARTDKQERFTNRLVLESDLEWEQFGGNYFQRRVDGSNNIYDRAVGFANGPGSALSDFEHVFGVSGAFHRPDVGFGGETAPSYAVDVNGTAAASTIRLGDYTVEQDSSDGDLNFLHSGSKVLELTDDGILRAAGDVVAFGLSGGGTTGSTSGLQANAPLNLDTTTDPDTISLSIGSGLTVNSGTLEADGSVGVSSVFGRTGDVTAQSGDYAHSQISGVSSDDHHTRYSDEEAQDAVGTILTDSGAASVTYDDAGNTITISATDTNTQLSDNEVQTAINNDTDHGSTASHNYTTSASGLTDVSPDSDPDAHHAVFEPTDYNPVSDVEAHGNALAIDITGDADTLDNHDASYFGALSENETVTGTWEFGGEISVYKSGSPTSPRRMIINRDEIRGDKFASTSIYARGNNNNEGLILGNSVPGSSDKPMIKAHLNGNVGIGDPPPTSPSYAVDVNGDINASGVGRFDITGDADTLDGVDGSSYARTDVAETFTETVKVGDGAGVSSFVNHGIAVGDSGGTPVEIKGDANRGSTGNAVMSFSGSWDGTRIGEIAFLAGPDTTNKDDGQIRIQTVSGGTFNPAVFITETQNVGIAGETNPSNALEVAGDMRATGEVEAFISSDRRLKTDLGPLDSALDKVGALTGYGFDWRGGDAVQPHKRGEKDVGLIAQEVEDVLPEAVKTFTDGHSEGYKSVSYDKLVPLLVEAIKDLRSQVNNLQ